MGEFLEHNWWWAVPLGIGAVMLVGFVCLVVSGLNDWTNRGSH